MIISRKKSRRPLHGWVVLDKPLTLSSTQALGRLKRIFNPEKAGHGGTLDPLATGVLPIALGDATKLIPYVMDAVKTYIFTVKWGEARTTDDAEGEVTERSTLRPSPDDIRSLLPSFEGWIHQRPPAYSALKIDGQRSYDLARQGNDVRHNERLVHIQNLTLASCDDVHHATFTVTCGKGTYVRSLARDIAAALQTVGYVTRLQRTMVGDFRLERAVGLSDLENTGENANDHILPLTFPLRGWSFLAFQQDISQRLRMGQKIPFSPSSDIDPARPFILKDDAGHAIGLGCIQDGRVCPIRIFHDTQDVS